MNNETFTPLDNIIGLIESIVHVFLQTTNRIYNQDVTNKKLPF